MNYLGDFTTSNTVYVYFNTFDSNDPAASVTLSGLAVTDIEIYKNGSTTQRSSDAGYALLDTDGIDFDGHTGIHGFSIDLSDNTDAGFFAAGGEYTVVLASVTVDAATVNFIACQFSIERTGGALALIKAGNLSANVVQISGDSIAADNAEAFFDGTGYAGTGNIIPTVTTLTGHTPQTGDSYARLGAPAGASVSADIAVIESQTDDIGVAGAGLTALATQASVNTIDDFLDTEIAAIKTKTDFLPSATAGAAGGLFIAGSNAATSITTALTANITGNITGNLSGSVGSLTGHTPQTGDSYARIGAAGAGLTALPWNAAWDAEIESEVNDAIDTAISELGVGAPTATPTLRTGMMLMYMALRNKTVVQTSGTDALEIYNNAGTKIASKLLTDDGSDYTEAEMA